MDTLRMQFENDPEPLEIQDILSGMLESPSMLAIFPAQDWIALDGNLRRKDRSAERINQPADPNHHWCYRLHFDISSLSGASALSETVINMLHRSGRYNKPL